MFDKLSLSRKEISVWIAVLSLVSFCAGITSALFLYTLQWVGEFRENHLWIIFGLPLAGMLIVYLYTTYGSAANKGNNLLFEKFYRPKTAIPFIMAPLVVVATLLTHLFGGSAGREGTAVQYGATFADYWADKFHFDKRQQRIVLIAGVSAGFSSLFATPLAGAVFAVEMFRMGKIRYTAFIPALFTAYLAYYICNFFGAPHTHYPIIQYQMGFSVDILWAILVGLLCGLATRLFVASDYVFSKVFKRIANLYLRIVSGSLVIMTAIYLLGTTRHIGLGMPTIVDSFYHTQNSYDFFLKILLTTLTLSIGFKGGEVTPLFFIGATLAAAIAPYIPVPWMIVIAMGFVSVFAGATKTPISCAVMAAELFGFSVLPIVLVATLAAYFVSGKKGIYSAQRNFRIL